jgi:hypothetical protein
MAQRAKRKIVKVDDVQRTLELRSPSSSVSTMTIQVPDMLMRSNRRQYQQARAYDCQISIGSIDVTGEHLFEIYTLSNAWWVKKSIEFAKGVYLHSTKSERAVLGNGKGKWNDFIITGSEIGAAANHSDLYQYSVATSGDDMTAAEVATDETLYESQAAGSEVEGDQDLGAEVSYGFTWAATDVTVSVRSYNIFDQYLLSRDTSNPAITASNGPYRDLLDVDHVAINDMKQDGDQAPFDQDAYPSPFVLADVIGVDQNLQAANVNRVSKLFTAPLGIVLIKKTTSGGAETNYTTNEKIMLHCRKGTYKGVHAPAYKATKLVQESSTVNKFRQ